MYVNKRNRYIEKRKVYSVKVKSKEKKKKWKN